MKSACSLSPLLYRKCLCILNEYKCGLMGDYLRLNRLSKFYLFHHNVGGGGGLFPAVNRGLGRDADHSPHLAPRSGTSRSCTFSSPKPLRDV
jgi:hypothetical protein